jgi:hypothetical protein
MKIVAMRLCSVLQDDRGRLRQRGVSKGRASSARPKRQIRGSGRRKQVERGGHDGAASERAEQKGSNPSQTLCVFGRRRAMRLRSAEARQQSMRDDAAAEATDCGDSDSNGKRRGEGHERLRSFPASSRAGARPSNHRPRSERPGWSLGRGPSGQRYLRSASLIGWSLMLAKRRRIRPFSSNSQFSLPCERNQLPESSRHS